MPHSSEPRPSSATSLPSRPAIDRPRPACPCHNIATVPQPGDIGNPRQARTTRMTGPHEQSLPEAIRTQLADLRGRLEHTGAMVEQPVMIPGSDETVWVTRP